MTPDQAGHVIAILNAAFPREALEKATIALWVDELGQLNDGDAAVETARSIARGSDRFPSIREFLSSYRTIRDRRRDERSLEPPVQDGPRELPEVVRAWMEARGVRTP